MKRWPTDCAIWPPRGHDPNVRRSGPDRLESKRGGTITLQLPAFKLPLRARHFTASPRRPGGELIGEAPARAGSGVEPDTPFAPSAVNDAAVAQARAVKPVGDLSCG
jgi:hypothetical protein